MDKVESRSIDAISSLPDDVLTHILSFLPTKRAIFTSILSKRWRSLFTMMTHLRFDDTDYLYPKVTKQRKDHARETFRALVDTTLSLQQQEEGGNSVSKKKKKRKRKEDGNYSIKWLKKFTLICEDDIHHFKAHTHRWISNAMKRGISDLDLRITMMDHDETLVKCPIPSDVFTSKTLVKLTLGTGLSIGKREVSLPVLKSLYLYTVKFGDGDFSDSVLRGCPVLEELYIHHENIHGGGLYDLCHPTIKRITIHRSANFTEDIRYLEFNTPNLVYLDYSERLVNCAYYSANYFLDSLLEARLDLFLPWHSLFEPWKLITCIRNVQILHLSSNTVELMLKCFDHWDSNGGFPIFRNLVKLYFDCKTKKGWKVLWSLINNSPKLETLILKGCFCSIRRRVEDSIEGNVLKVLKICGFTGTRRELLHVQRILLELEFLQVMTVKVDDKKIDDDKKLQLTKDLLALPKFSSNCQIQFL